jgi:ABC-type multidrug transport system permease subunit
MYSIAALVPHYIIGMAVGSGAFGFFMLCEGFLKIKSQIPGYLIWGHYMAPHTYTFRIFMYNEFNDLGALQSQQFPTGKDVLRFYDMENADIVADFIVLVAFAAAFQLVFFSALYFLHTGKR